MPKVTPAAARLRRHTSNRLNVIYVCMCIYVYIYIYIHIHMYVCVYTYIYIYIHIWLPSPRAVIDRGSLAECTSPSLETIRVRGWWNTVGNVIEIIWLKQTYHGLEFTGICVNNRRVRFHRIRDFKQYCFNSIPPTSHRVLNARLDM